MADIKKLIEQKKKQLHGEQITRDINTIADDILGYEKQPTAVQNVKKIEQEWEEEEQDRDEHEQQVVDLKQRAKTKKQPVNNTSGWEKNIEHELEYADESRDAPLLENDGFKIVKDSKMTWAERVKAKQQEKKRTEAAFDEDAFFVVGQETEIAKKAATKPVVERATEDKPKRPMFTNSNKAAINNNRPLEGAGPVQVQPQVAERQEESKVSFGHGPLRFSNKAKQGGFADIERSEVQLREEMIEMRLKERAEANKTTVVSKPKFFNKNKKEGETMNQGLICTQTTVSVTTAARKISEKENTKSTDNKEEKKAMTVVAAAWD